MKPAQFIVLCEDKQQRVFVRRFLRRVIDITLPSFATRRPTTPASWSEEAATLFPSVS